MTSVDNRVNKPSDASMMQHRNPNFYNHQHLPLTSKNPPSAINCVHGNAIDYPQCQKQPVAHPLLAQNPILRSDLATNLQPRRPRLRSQHRRRQPKRYSPRRAPPWQTPLRRQPLPTSRCPPNQQQRNRPRKPSNQSMPPPPTSPPPSSMSSSTAKMTTQSQSTTHALPFARR
jgi:hypothetical protein